MERLQREKEAGAHKPQSRLSVDDLLFKEEATAHRTDTAAQPELVPSGENQKRPGSCPPPIQASRGTSYQPVWDSAFFTAPPSSIPHGTREPEMRPSSNFPSQGEPAAQLQHTYGFGEGMAHNQAVVTNMSSCSNGHQVTRTLDNPACQYIHLKAR